jgi:hypothetical protein
MKVYFDPVNYPAVAEDSDIGFVTLKKDLELVAVAHGFYMKLMVVVNIPSPACSSVGVILHILLPVMKKELFSGFSLHYDSLNSRGSDGQLLP